MTDIIEPVHVPVGVPEMEIYDVEVQHINDYIYECTAKTSRGDISVRAPVWADKPPDMKAEVWVSRLSKQEVMAGAKVYTDIWTWLDDSEHFRMMMDLFVQFLERKLKNVTPVAEGTMRYNTATLFMESMVNGEWIRMAATP